MSTKYDFGGVEESRRRIMRAIGPKDTRPERLVRSILHLQGFRFRKNFGKLSGSPDVVFTRKRKVIFIHGCFWHFHENCAGGRTPTKRTDYWLPKLEANRRRDRLNCDKLSAEGWRVLTVWECELADEDRLLAKLLSFVNS